MFCSWANVTESSEGGNDFEMNKSDNDFTNVSRVLIFPQGIKIKINVLIVLKALDLFVWN